MAEWIIEIPEELKKELENSFRNGAILNEQGRRPLNEEVVDRLNGLKIFVFSNEHPPPHFRVCYQNECNDFYIKNCAPMYGNALSKYLRNIKKWHKKNKNELIQFWNKKRPTDCPVGEYKEGLT